MPIPNEIPVGARIVVRTLEGVDPTDHRMKFRDYVGHVLSLIHISEPTRPY